MPRKKNKNNQKSTVAPYASYQNENHLDEEANEDQEAPRFLRQDNEDDQKLEVFAEVDDFMVPNSPQYLRSDGVDNENKDYVINPDVCYLSSSNEAVPSMYLRDSQECDIVEDSHNKPILVQSQESIFQLAYGSYNEVNKTGSLDYSAAYGEENSGDSVLGGDFMPLDNMLLLNSSYDKPNEPDPEVPEDSSPNEEIELVKPNKDISLMGAVSRRKWANCGCPIDWNRQFQRLLELDDSTEEARLRKYRKLSALSADFVHTAKNFGKIIISECSLNGGHRTLIPHPNVGGIAGGEKYVYHGMLFKFATNDKNNIYKSDENAMKAAGHELKGVMRYAQCEGLHVPLVAVIDYRGFRLVAESILPIRPGSLLYGSSDGGKTVYKENETLSKLMAKAGKQLNIKPHYGGLDENNGKFIYGPTDIEAHKGDDNRFYVLDFARVFPPTAEEGVTSTYLYKLFRPEFVRAYKIPLSSDGFSKFGVHNKREHNKEIREATAYLLKEVIPHFAKVVLPSMFPDNGERFVRIKELTEITHRAGINVRYFGLVRHYAPEYLKSTILIEMCARAIKNRLRKNLRDIGKGLRRPKEDKFRQEAIKFLNLVLGHDTEKYSAIVYWRTLIKSDILHSFGNEALTQEEKSTDFDLRDLIDIVLLFKRVQVVTGVVLTKQAQRDLRQHPESFQIVQPDVNKVSVKVKHMNIISLAEAQALAIESMRQNRSSERLFRLACSKFEFAIRATPDNLPTLNTYADFLVDYATKNPYRADNMNLFRKAFEKYKTTKNFTKIFELAQALQNFRHFGVDRNDAVIQCYTAIYEGVTKTDKLWSYSLRHWGQVLIQQARRLFNWDLYNEAGAKYRESLDDVELPREYNAIRDIAKKISDHELAILFEIHQQSPTFRVFDSSWCFKAEKITKELLCTIVQHFPVKQLRLPACIHLLPLDFIAIIKVAPNFVQLNFSQHPMLSDSVLSAIRECCRTSLTSLDVSSCPSITERGFEHIEQCNQLKHLNISHCKETKRIISNASLCFSFLESFHFASCSYIRINDQIKNFRDCPALEELNMSGLSSLSTISQLESFPKLRKLDITNCGIKTLEPLYKSSLLEELRIKKNKELQGETLAKLAPSISNLRVLDISSCALVSSQHFITLSEHCTNLTHLALTKTANLSTDGMKCIFTNLLQLEELSISHVPMEEPLSEMGMHFPHLRKLSLVNCSLMKSISQIASCSSLEELNLSRNKEISEESLGDILQSCVHISKLDISLCIRLTDETIETIGRCLRFLECLNISQCQLYSNLNPLVQCRRLSSLNADGCKQVKEINDVLTKSYLTELYVKECLLGDSFLSAAGDCLSLVKISFGRNKVSNKTMEAFMTRVSNRPSLIVDCPYYPLRSGFGGGLANRVAARTSNGNLRETR